MEALEADLRDIAAVLSKPDLRHEALKIRTALMKVHELADQNRDVIPLAGYIIKLLPSHDMIVKKLACQYVIRYSQCITDIHLMVVNSLYRDCSDPNPAVRALALQTLCSNLQIGDHTETLLSTALQDPDPHVRRSAVLCCGVISRHSPSFIAEQGFVDDLYSMLRDPDPLVVADCLVTLDDILSEEGGVVVNKNIAHYLISRIGAFSEWNLIHVLQYLRKYQPHVEDDLLEFMNILDGYFEHSNCAVVVEAIQLFSHFAHNLSEMKLAILERAKPQLCTFLTAANPELTYTVLKFIKQLVTEQPTIFADSYQKFFCKHNEPIYVKEKKIELLSLLVSESNSEQILENLVIYTRDPSMQLASAAIKALVKIANRNSECAPKCTENLLQLLDFEDDVLTNEVVYLMHSLKMENEDLRKQIICRTLQCVDKISNTEAKSAFVWLLGEYGATMHQCPSVLEKTLRRWEEDDDLSLRLNLMIAVLKVFFVRPAECQDMVGHVLELCLQDTRMILRDRAFYYYRLLETDVNLAKAVIMGT